VQGTILDPLGIITLVPKYRKMLENQRLRGIRLTFRSGGITVQGQLPPVEGSNAEGVWRDLPDAIVATATETVPEWNKEKSYRISKFESRLDLECPEALRNAASEEAWNAAMAATPFQLRKGYNMSNKDFERAYARFVNGTPVIRSNEEQTAYEQSLRPTVVAGRGGRGRGRGGRGRGSAFQAQVAPNEAQA